MEPSPQIQGLNGFYRMKDPNYVRALSELCASLDRLEKSDYETNDGGDPGDVIDAWQRFKEVMGDQG